MKCERCGGANFKWAGRCDHCGVRFGMADAPTRTAVANQGAPQKQLADSWHGPGFSVGDLVTGRMIVESVKSGGMAFVYICRYLSEEDARTIPGAAKGLFFPNSMYAELATQHRYAALKSFRPYVWHSDIAERFQHEANLWLGLPAHPHVVSARTLRHARLSGLGGALLELEYVNGGTLADRLKQGRPTIAEAIRIARDVCSGMIALARSAVVHRDIKPANIMLTQSGRAKVSDFGIARAFDAHWQAKRLDLTSRLEGARISDVGRRAAGAFVGLTHSMAGTAPYMPPEYWVGDVVPTIRGDVYSFGAVLYEMLVGEQPFRAQTSLEMRDRHLGHIPPPPFEAAGVDRRLSDVCMKCLGKRAEERFADFTELNEALGGCGGPAVLNADDDGFAGGASAVDCWTRSRARLQAGHAALAIDDAEQALARAPTLSHVHLQLASVLQEIGREDAARAHEDKERTLHPANPDLHLYMARRYLADGRHADAAGASRRAVELAPEWQAAQETLFFVTDAWCAASGLPEEGKRSVYGKAAAELMVSLELHGGQTAPLREWMELACLLGDRDHHFVAMQLHGACTRRFPLVAVNWYNYGVTCHRAGELERAAACYTNASTLDGASVLALANRGCLHWQRGDLTAARQDWTAAVTHQPTHLAARWCQALLGRGDDELASTPLRNDIKHLAQFGPLGYHL